MKLVKSLLLGSAAGLIAVGGAQAADLPVKAKAVEYVKICSLYGAGFYYIPGTDTCIKLGGYLRAEVAINATDFNGNFSSVNGSANRLTNYYVTRAREDFNVDTRTATEYGVVRTFADVVFSWTTDNYSGNGTGNGSTVYSQLGSTGVGGPNNATSGAIAGGTLGVYYAFIQFAGFTMGKAVAQFDAPWTNYPGNNFDGLTGGGGTVTGVNSSPILPTSVRASLPRFRRWIRRPTIRATCTTPAPAFRSRILVPAATASMPSAARGLLTSRVWSVLTRLGVCSSCPQRRTTTT
ncbi:hypothetical protein ABID62_001039 [Bradyrhizobium sp. S3.9.1]